MRKKVRHTILLCFINHENLLLSFFNDYALLVLAAKYKAFHGKYLKIKISKQILQRFPIKFAQVKAGNTSENLLNELDKSFIHYIEEKKSLIYIGWCLTLPIK